MKRNTLMTILAMSLTLGASRAAIPTDTNKTAQHFGLAQSIPIGPAGVIAEKNPDEEQKPAQSSSPGDANRGKPLQLLAPGSGGCPSCKSSPFSSWQQFQMALSMLFLV